MDTHTFIADYLFFALFIFYFGKGNGNPFQYSWLEKSHGQRSLVGYSPWVTRVRHNLVTKPPPPPELGGGVRGLEEGWKGDKAERGM